MNGIAPKLRLLKAFWHVMSRGGSLTDPAITRFEDRFAKYTQSKHAFAVASGTDALVVSLKAYDIGPGDEVIVPALGFISMANAIAWINARPVFADVEEHGFNLDASKIEHRITPKTKAIIVAHLNGTIASMDRLQDLSIRHGIPLIIDASHALGSKYNNAPIGCYGDVVCVSLNFTKPLGSLGNGGIILTDNTTLTKKIQQLTTYGASSIKDIYTNCSSVGIITRLDPFQASVLNEKLSQLKPMLQQQRANYLYYHEFLSSLNLIATSIDRTSSNSNGYRYPFATTYRDELQSFLQENDIRVKPYYHTPLPFQPSLQHLGYHKGDFPNAEWIASHGMILPTDHTLPHSYLNHVVNLIQSFNQDRKN